MSLNATDHIPGFGKKIDRPLGSFIPLHGSDLNICSRIFIPFVVRGINFFNPGEPDAKISPQGSGDLK